MKDKLMDFFIFCMACFGIFCIGLCRGYDTGYKKGQADCVSSIMQYGTQITLEEFKEEGRIQK